MLNLLVWLVAFLMQAGLLGTTMYGVGPHTRRLCIKTYNILTTFVSLQLISLSDLENDFVNPHDASAAINYWVVSCACAT